MAQLKSTKVFGDLNVTGEVNVSTKITVNGKEVWDTGNLLNIGATAATARTALGLGAGATRWPTFAEVTGKPATYAPSGHTHPSSQVTGLDTALADKADKTTQVIAGTGLTGGGTLSENSTLSVSYGTTAGTSVQGNDTRVVNAVPNSRTITAGTGLSGGGTLAANRTLSVSYGTTAGTAAQGNDARFDNGQTAFGWGSHASAGYAKTKADIGLSGIPDTNTSTVNFLRGDGTWVTPPNTNTTYAEITTAEIDAGTATTLRTVSGRRMKYALDKKSDTGHTHTWAQVTGQPATATRWPTFAEVTGQPATATRWPTWEEVTGKPTNYATTWASVAAKPAQATRWPTWEEVTGKPATPSPWPVGSCYTQYPDTAAPASLFGGTWKQLFNTEGVFFRTEGGGASDFGGGVQGDDNKSHTHTASTNNTGAHTHSVSGTAASAGAHTHPINHTHDFGRSSSPQSAAGKNTTDSKGTSVSAGAHTHTVSGTAASAGAHAHTVTVAASGGTEARPKNRTIRVWQRTA